MIAVRGASNAIQEVCGRNVVHHPNYKEALKEVAIFLNAAITAYDVERELKVSSDGRTRVVYGVFDLVDQQVRSQPAKDIPVFADVPSGPDELNQLGDRLARAILRKRLKGRGAPRSR